MAEHTTADAAPSASVDSADGGGVHYSHDLHDLQPAPHGFATRPVTQLRQRNTVASTLKQRLINGLHTIGIAWESIRWWFVVLALTSVFAVALFKAVYRDQVDSLDREWLYLLSAEVRDKIEADLQLGVDLTEARGAQNQIDELITKDPSIRAVEIFDRDGISVVNTDRGSINERVSPVWMRQAGSLSGRYWVVFNVDETVIGMPLRNAYDVEPFAHLAVTYARTRADATDQRQSADLTAALLANQSGVAVVLVLLLAISVASLFMLRTARQIRQEVEVLETQQSAVDFPLDSDELTQATAVLNRSRERLANAMMSIEGADRSDGSAGSGGLIR
jgi:hypothetical protein